MDIFKMVFGRKKVVADVEPAEPEGPSKLELALGREGADALIRDLKAAKAVEDSGDPARAQEMAKAALAKSAEYAKRETDRILGKKQN